MQNKIEKIVRHYVKKTLSEIFEDVDSLIEQKVKLRVEQRLQLKDLLREDSSETKNDLCKVFENVETKTKIQSPSYQKKITAEDFGITEDVWKSVYEDTLSSENPILSEERVPEPGEGVTPDKPEYVSEAAMKQFGLMKDFSKHVEAFDEIDKKKHISSQEDEEAQKAYRKALLKIEHHV